MILYEIKKYRYTDIFYTHIVHNLHIAIRPQVLKGRQIALTAWSAVSSCATTELPKRFRDVPEGEHSTSMERKHHSTC